MEVGDRVDRYVVERKIGEGGMATVYLARHETLRSLHALKVLRIDVPSIKTRLLTEGRVQASLRHPNIVAVTDVLDTDGVCALVMEYVDGPGLDQWIDNPKIGRDLDVVLDIFKGIALGVAAAHKAGLVHRDLKPDNVLLSTSNAGLTPKVTDFGLVKVTDASHTRSGVLMGTPEYMSPEQVRDSAHVDWRSDVWALGVMLYELLTGRVPFVAAEVLDVYNLIVEGAYTPLRELRDDLPEAVYDVVTGLLMVDRDERIQSADDVLQRLYAQGAMTSHAPSVSRAQLMPTATPMRPLRSTVPDLDISHSPPTMPERDEMPMGPPSPVPAAVVGALVGVVGFLVVAALCLGLFYRPQPVELPPDPVPAAPPPTPAVLPRPVTLEVPVETSRLEVDGKPVTDGLSLAPGAHEIWVEAGTCAVEDRGCAPACPHGCSSRVLTVEIPEGDGAFELLVDLQAPTVKPQPAPVAPKSRVVSGSSYQRWLKKHPEWSKDEAREKNRADQRYLRKWKPDAPPGPLTQIPWRAAKAYCAGRGGLVGLNEAPLTWKAGGVNQEWRDNGGKPSWRRFDGVTSTANPGNESFTFTGARCRR